MLLVNASEFVPALEGSQGLKPSFDLGPGSVANSAYKSKSVIAPPPAATVLLLDGSIGGDRLFTHVTS